jgi:Acetyltransferase (GNAT) domain
MTPIRIAIIEDLIEAEKLWNHFSPHLSLYDEWDFRLCFLKRHTGDRLRFITAFEGDDPVGLLPLQFSLSKQQLEFMGGFFMEDNRVFLKPGHETLAQTLFSHVQGKANLRCFLGDENPFLQSFPPDYPVYSARLEGLATRDQYIDRFFQSKSRANLKKKIRQVLELHPNVVLNRLEDLDLLAHFNIQTFGPESSFVEDPAQKSIFLDLCHSRHPSFVHSFEVDGQTEAVSFSLLFKDAYYYILSGTNKTKVPNLGNYLVIKNIETALEHHCRTFDAGRHDCNWKERWHLEKVGSHRYDFPPLTVDPCATPPPSSNPPMHD